MPEFRRVKGPSAQKEAGKENPDNRAELEEAAVGEQQQLPDLTNDAQQSEHYRREKIRNHIGHASLLGVWLAWSIGVVAVVIWTWHLLAPSEWRYLEDVQIDRLESILFGVVITALVSAFGRKYF
ncbi:MAG: hypothetical protein AAGC95_04110 [Pseudomonadota bacterium]